MRTAVFRGRRPRCVGPVPVRHVRLLHDEPAVLGQARLRQRRDRLGEEPPRVRTQRVRRLRRGEEGPQAHWFVLVEHRRHIPPQGPSGDSLAHRPAHDRRPRLDLAQQRHLEQGQGRAGQHPRPPAQRLRGRLPLRQESPRLFLRCGCRPKHAEAYEGRERIRRDRKRREGRPLQATDRTVHVVDRGREAPCPEGVGPTARIGLLRRARRFPHDHQRPAAHYPF